MWLVAAAKPAVSVATAAFVLTPTALFLESIECKTLLDSVGDNRAPEARSGLWTRTAFTWLATTFRAGYVKVMSPTDLPSLDPKLESRVLYSKVASTWAKCR